MKENEREAPFLFSSYLKQYFCLNVFKLER